MLSCVRCVLAMGLACVVAGVSAPATGADHLACDAIRTETLRPGSERRARLSVGDRLVFTFRAEPSAKAVLELAEGGGSPRVVAQDTGGGSYSYVARTSGDLRFEVKARADESATVLVRCTSAQKSGRDLVSRMLAAEGAQVLVEPTGPEPLVELGASSDDTLRPGMIENEKRPLPNVAVTTPLYWEDSRAGGVEGAAGPVKLAAKYKPQPAIMVGVLAQFDQPDDKSPVGSGRIDQNWLAGPVTRVELIPGTTLDARAAWGLLDSGVVPNAYGADRRLVDAKLSSTQSFGAWRFSPSVTMNLEETRQTSAVHEGQSGLASGTSRVDVRPELAYRFDMGQSLFIEPKAAIGGVWELDTAALAGASTPHGAMRLKADTGVTIGSSNGTKLELGAGVEESAVNGPNVWSGRLQLSVPVK